MASLTPFVQKLGRRQAAHLLRRLTFGASKTAIDTLAGLTAQQACELLLAPVAPWPEPSAASGGRSWVTLPATDESLDHGQLKTQVLAWWLEEMLRADLSATPKLTFFLHTHFTTMAGRLPYAHALYHQLKLFRFYTSGSLRPLAYDLCLDSAMLLHLDGALNEKGRPNENYAREFFELYTIGKGPQRGPGDYTHFTEEDVLAAAKVFSGYKLDKTFSDLHPEHGCAMARLEVDARGLATRHDASVKQFSPAFAQQTIAPAETHQGLATEAAALEEVRQLVDMVFAQKETARHLCRKIYRFFVFYDIPETVEQAVIEPLADLMLQHDYHLMPVLTALCASQHFYDTHTTATDHVNGALIKSPLDIVVGTLQFFQVTSPPAEPPVAYQKMMELLELQGLPLYEPFEVAGYPAYHQFPGYQRNWITANYLARRYEFSVLLVEGIKSEENTRLWWLDMVAYVADPNRIADPMNPRQMVETLLGDLLPEAITEARFTYFLKVILLDSLSEKNWQVEWQRYLDTGNDTAVRSQLENLVKTILQSPEYQLS